MFDYFERQEGQAAIQQAVQQSHLTFGQAQQAEAERQALTQSTFALAEAQLAQAQLAEAQLAEAQLAEAQLAEAQLAEAQLAEAQLAQAQLAEAQPTFAFPQQQSTFISNSTKPPPSRSSKTSKFTSKYKGVPFPIGVKPPPRYTKNKKNDMNVEKEKYKGGKKRKTRKNKRKTRKIKRKHKKYLKRKTRKA
jgi:hypothetical protein